MVQREVAKEMPALPGKMGILLVATQVYGRPRIVASVPPKAFRPAPKVRSAVVRIDVYDKPAVSFDSAEGFFRVVKAGFSAPRKQLRNCMRQALGLSSDEVERLLGQAGIDPVRRPQTVAIPEWGQIYEAYRASTVSPLGRPS